MEPNVYQYRGPVMRFDICIERDWGSCTRALSEEKAINNLKHQYRKQHNLARNTKITLPGTLTKIEVL